MDLFQRIIEAGEWALLVRPELSEVVAQQQR
jgi:hypothetical protein